jgi:enoyl-CoA hydratase/carnithine racemase
MGVALPESTGMVAADVAGAVVAGAVTHTYRRFCSAHSLVPLTAPTFFLEHVTFAAAATDLSVTPSEKATETARPPAIAKRFLIYLSNHQIRFLRGERRNVFPMPSVLSFDELYSALRFGGEAMALQSPPIVLVDLASDPSRWNAPSSESTTTIAGLLSLPCVVVGVGSVGIGVVGFGVVGFGVVGFGAMLSELGSVGAIVDVVASSPHEVDELVAAITRFPIASVTLALLLRGRDRRTLDDALIAESMAYSMLQAGPEFAAWRSTYVPKSTIAETQVPVLVSREEDRLLLTLNRPARHNAFSMSMRDGLVAGLEIAALDEDVAVVLHGNGPSFCSGGELAEFGSFVDPASAHQTRLTRSAARQLARIAGRVTVRVHGFCLGAGIELSAFATRIVAHPDSVFALPELALGLIPGSGGTASLPPRIGRHRTALMALTGRRIDATTAMAWGLIDEISDSFTDLSLIR